jgi:predicted metal-dependent hydrolase
MKQFFLTHLKTLIAYPSEFNYQRYLEGDITLFNAPFRHTFEHISELNDYLKERLMTEIKRLEKHYKSHQKWIDLEGLKYEIKFYKSRFGSCHPHQRIIRFNQILAHYDKTYLEYIYVHEIAHLNEQNHQKGFYDLLDQLLPHHQSLSKSLKMFHARFIKDAL